MQSPQPLNHSLFIVSALS